MTAIAIPLASPPPPTGTTTLREVGHVLEQLEPERALAGDDVRVVERVHERQPALARALARAADAVVDRRRRRGARSRPCPRAASALAIGASAGTKTSHGTPRVARGRRQRLGVVAGDAATTPRAQPASPSAASFAAAPRILNEPVRCRFSAFSTTSPPARSEIVRVESTGVRRAIGARTARVRATAATVDASRSTVRACVAMARQSGRAMIGVDLDLRRPRGSAATPNATRAGGSHRRSCRRPR